MADHQWQCVALQHAYEWKVLCRRTTQSKAAGFYVKSPLSTHANPLLCKHEPSCGFIFSEKSGGIRWPCRTNSGKPTTQDFPVILKVLAPRSTTTRQGLLITSLRLAGGQMRDTVRMPAVPLAAHASARDINTDCDFNGTPESPDCICNLMRGGRKP